jgi:hypothetical protein
MNTSAVSGLDHLPAVISDTAYFGLGPTLRGVSQRVSATGDGARCGAKSLLLHN